MKNYVLNLFLGVSFILLTLVSINTSAANAFANYTITSVDNQELAEGAACGWILSYGEDTMPVQICLHETKKQKTYVVKTDYFEVAYVSSKKGFGTATVKSIYSTIPENLTNEVVSSTAVENQRVITMSEVDDETAISLIASYLPELVNSKYQSLLN